MAGDTKESILDAAEALFGAQGFSGTSLRNITAAAGVNIASVNYHFGSKEALIEAVFARRLLPMNEARLQRLGGLEQAYGTGAIPLRDLVGAFIAPAMELSRDTEGGGQQFVRLLGRSYTEPSEWLHERVRAMYGDAIERFKPAFARSLPHLPTDELYWRMHFMIGVLAYCMAGTDMMRLIASCRLSDASDTGALTQRLITFLEAGLNAPVAPAPEAMTLKAGETG